MKTNSFDPAGRLGKISDGTNSAAYSYIANSMLIDHISFASNGTTVMITSNKYDLMNRLTNIVSASNSVVLAKFQYQYNSANQRTAVTNADGTRWAFGYDSLGQVTSGIKSWSDSTPVAGEQFGYTFDTIGNRTQAAQGGDQYGANLRYASYTPNNLNQYTSRTVPGAVDIIGTATNTATVSVNNNAAYRKSNYFRVQLALTNTSGPVFQSVTNIAVLNRVSNPDLVATNIGDEFLPQSPESYTYDNDGDLLSDGHWNYTWDAENRLTALTNNASIGAAGEYLLNFTYDYQGRRIQKTVYTNNGSAYVPSYTNQYVYDGWNVEAILDGNNNLLYSFTWGTDLSGSMQGAGGVGGLVSMTVCSGSNAGKYFYCYDGNGNVVALVNARTGAIVAQYEYGPFGEVIRATGPMAKLNPFRFSTKYQDDETDFLYYGCRYYNPNTGRWTCRDSAREDEGGPNLYAFVSNDPLDEFDLLGNLGYTTVSLTKLTCGLYTWSINWTFSPGEFKGYVVQKVTATEMGNHCSGVPYPWSPLTIGPYWEAFEVVNGQAGDAWNNRFNAGSDTYGKIHVDGDAAFFGIGDTAAMKAIAKWKPLAAANGLPGTLTPPAFWPGTGSHVVRYLDDFWECCCGHSVTSIITK